MSGSVTAYRLWRAGARMEAGKLLFEEIPRDQRGQWASSVLTLALRFAPVSNVQVRRLSRMARRRCLWFTAHSHFEYIRNQTIRFERKVRKGETLSHNDTIRRVL